MLQLWSQARNSSSCTLEAQECGDWVDAEGLSKWFSRVWRRRDAHSSREGEVEVVVVELELVEAVQQLGLPSRTGLSTWNVEGWSCTRRGCRRGFPRCIQGSSTYLVLVLVLAVLYGLWRDQSLIRVPASITLPVRGNPSDDLDSKSIYERGRGG
jgi:hypothetical protein